MKRKNLLLISFCIILIVGSFIIGSKGEFGGADDQIEGVISEVNKEYTPWFNHIWEPPSGEVESFLFAFQAAAGAGFVGYYIGTKRNIKNDNVREAN